MGRDGQSVVEKVRRVLDCYLRAGAASLSFAELLERSGISRASLHRTLTEMAENGLLAQAGRGEEYRLGPVLRSTAALSVAISDLPAIALPRMEELRDECRETVALAELHGPSVVPVQRADGLYELRMNQEVGRRYPAHAGATGKVLIANLPPAERDQLLAGLELEELTPLTRTDRERLLADLELISEAGVGVSLGERVPDAVAISAPVFDATGRVAAALTISGIASRYERERLREDAIAVRRAADAISEDAGYTGAPETRLNDPKSPQRAALERMCDAAWSASAAGARSPTP